MSEFEYRAVTEFLVLEGNSCKDIHEKLVKVYKDDDNVPTLEVVQQWVDDLQNNRNEQGANLANDNNGRRCAVPPKPRNAPSEENVKKVQDLLIKDQRIKEADIFKALGISKVTIHHILNDVLAMKKVHGRWVSRVLTTEQRNNRLQISQRNLERIQSNSRDFLNRFVTVTEEWLTFADEKIKTAIFWDAKGVLLIDYLGKGKTMNGVYYANLLDQLYDQLKDQRSHLALKEKNSILFYQPNGQVQSSVVVADKIHELNFEILEQPQHSPDLSPSDYHLYPNLEKYFKGKKFESIADFILGVNRHFDGYSESYYRSAVLALEKKYQRCIELQGEYVE